MLETLKNRIVELRKKATEAGRAKIAAAQAEAESVVRLRECEELLTAVLAAAKPQEDPKEELPAAAG